MRYLKYYVAFTIAAFYAVALVLDRSASILYTLMLPVGLVALARGWQPEGIAFGALVRRYWVVVAAMAMPLLAVFANQIATAHFAGRPYDAQSRLALFCIVFWLMLFLPIGYLRRMPLVMAAGAVLAMVKMYVMSDGGDLRYGTDFIPIIICSHMGLLLGVFAAFSTGWNKRGEYLQIAIKLLALGAGLYMAFLSGSRGVWMTILVYGLIGAVCLKHIQRRIKVGIAVAFLAVAVLGLHYSANIQHRIDDISANWEHYADNSDRDTSLGLRLQLWHGSWLLFKQRPAFGVGIDRFQPALEGLAEQKIISPFAATLPHSHNEMLFMMVRLGSLGALALLALYLAPLLQFTRVCRHPDKEIRCAAGMGMALVLGFMVLGLVDVVFLWWECYPYYALGIAFCLCYIIKRRRELGESALA